MANLLWGNIYYQDKFAGMLRQEPGERMSFTYNESYLQNNYPRLAYTLPLQSAPFLSQRGLHPFFDNLVAEGWLEGAQARLLGKRGVSRFELLLAFGSDCAGAVSIADPDPASLSQKMLDLTDPREMAVLTSRVSLSGVQPKLALIEEKGKLRPAKINELSTHIGKFPSPGHDDIVINEYLTTLAFKALLANDDIVDLWIDNIEGFKEPLLIIKRFDRAGGERLHFEEFNQLLGKESQAKYDGSYKDMADFIRGCGVGLPTEVYHLFVRILAGILLGNTDMHLKNFAMFHKPEGLRLTPTYDQVAAALYDYKSMALAIGGARDRLIGNLNHRSIIRLGEEFALPNNAIDMAVKTLGKNREQALHAIENAPVGSIALKTKLVEFMEKRWNGTFALIGPSLSKKR